jgi:pimeloyl-ACP methyl ester carboxylesterase
MIRIITSLIVTLLFFITSIFSQESNFKGDWYGLMDVQSTKLRINFHISEKDGVYASTMDSPDQGARAIPTTKTTVNNSVIEISLENLKVTYLGELKNDIIDGVFKQNGYEFPLVLSHKKIEKETQKSRPQDPKKPYPYKSETVYFVNKEANNIKLAGTLTLPNKVKNPPVVILISGSGPQNRDEELMNHRPFLVLADHLTKQGIAVLRYDDRGVAESEGSQNNATSADFATDVEAAITYLKTRKDVNIKKIGLIGHSEGGFIAPMLASKNDDVAFIVLLAGTGVDGEEVLLTQSKRASELAGVSEDVIAYNEDLSKELYKIIKDNDSEIVVKEKAQLYFKELRENNSDATTKSLTDVMVNQIINGVSNNWMMYFIKTDPKQFLNKVTCPVLAINGSKDFQVLPKLNLGGIKKALKNNKDVTTQELEGLNHLFQACETGSINEYSQIEETFNPKALKVVSDWINARF